jgi:Fe2+ transport system protein FeoA
MELSMKHRRKEPQNLHELGVGQCGIVTEIRSTGAMKRRLVDMGITPGTTVYVRKVAPLGDPIQINLRGYELLVRGSEAREILIRTGA